MSVSSIASTNNVYRNQIVQAFSNLQSSLSSGNLSTAQQAYGTLMQDLQGLQQTQGAQQTGSQIGIDLAAMGSALQSGNITVAQSAFATLMQDLGNGSTGTLGSSLFPTAGSNINILV